MAIFDRELFKPMYRLCVANVLVFPLEIIHSVSRWRHGNNREVFILNPIPSSTGDEAGLVLVVTILII
jgi:hypothetical protein